MTRTPQWDATGRRVLEGDGEWLGFTGQKLDDSGRELVTIYPVKSRGRTVYSVGEALLVREASDAAAAERVAPHSRLA